MEYKLYDNSEALLIETTSSSSRESWNLANGIVMDNGEEYFGWTPLKIDDGQGKMSRKRKLSTEARDGQRTKIHGYELDKDPLAFDEKTDDVRKGSHNVKGTSRMPQWQVEEYGDIHPGIDSTLNLDSDLSDGAYNSESMLAINNMTVFKQESPSPTMNEMQVARHHRQSPTSTQPMANAVNSTMEENSQNIFSNTINQLLSQSALVNLHTVIDNSNLSTSSHSQDNFAVTSTNYNLVENCRFQYVLAAATSIATKQNEDTLTYLNQGQSYEIKLKKLGDLSMYRGKLLKSVVRICFHERRLQYMEKEQMESWQKTRPGDRILEVDIPLSYGAFDVYQPTSAVNVITFVWDPTKEVGVYIKVNCISTEFTPKKHGGEKGVPFRIQVETFQNGDTFTANKRLHAAACQIKVFKLKGADRKHKQDREKIMKRPLAEQEKYQSSYDCTVLTDIPNDAVLNTPVPTVSSMTSNDSDPVERPQNGHNGLVRVQSIEEKEDSSSGDSQGEEPVYNEKLTQYSSSNDTAHWLTVNRFGQYLEMFARFSGADMMRLSRDELVQICGRADGIRLHNAMHMRAIAPLLRFYVRRENQTVFNAIFLTSYNHVELLQKLSSLAGLNPSQIKAIYIEGPQAIHIQLNDEMLRHLEDETRFSLNVIAEDGSYVLLLKKRVE